MDPESTTILHPTPLPQQPGSTTAVVGDRHVARHSISLAAATVCRHGRCAFSRLPPLPGWSPSPTPRPSIPPPHSPYLPSFLPPHVPQPSIPSPRPSSIDQQETSLEENGSLAKAGRCHCQRRGGAGSLSTAPCLLAGTKSELWRALPRAVMEQRVNTAGLPALPPSSPRMGRFQF